MSSFYDPAAPPGTPIQTAVVVPVPEADLVVNEHRQRLDRAAVWGVPAHVSVVYPFAPPATVDDGVVARLTAAVASVRAFDCTFATTSWFGRDVLWLAPEPAEPFQQLTSQVWAAFPDFPPYGGAFADPVAHLTVAERALGQPGDLAAVEAAVQPVLPIRQRIDHVLLIAGNQQPNSWRILHRIDLADS